MGTRADVYLGKDEHAEWLGSIAWDGYPEGLPKVITASRQEQGYRGAVAYFVQERDDGTHPDQGWPWPWNNSRTTDCAYTFSDDEVWCSRFGRPWARVHDYLRWTEEQSDDYSKQKQKVLFPDMSARKATTFGERSGLIILEARK